MLCSLRKKGKPVLEEYASYTDEQICGEYFMYADKHKLVDTLKALSGGRLRTAPKERAIAIAC